MIVGMVAAHCFELSFLDTLTLAAEAEDREGTIKMSAIAISRYLLRNNAIVVAWMSIQLGDTYWLHRDKGRSAYVCCC